VPATVPYLSAEPERIERWMRGREDSPWYPTMRLFRQERWGDWTAVFERMAGELRQRTFGLAAPVTAEIAPGELLDKMTILQIKRDRVADARKQQTIRVELGSLLAAQARSVRRSGELTRLTRELQEVNAALWDVEDAIRGCEEREEFGERFIELARSVYRTNDARAEIKRRINQRLGSPIREEKSYTATQECVAYEAVG
jgi:hypothetical protein